MNELLNSGLYFDFLVIGQAEISVEQRLKYRDAIAAINFIGHIPQNEMMDAMLSSHIYLFPSLSEGCAKSAYEAMSMGLCVVVTKETGLPLIDGVNGALIESRSSESIVKKILALLGTPEKIRSMGIAGSKTMRKYTWEFYAKNLVGLYDELMAGESQDAR